MLSGAAGAVQSAARAYHAVKGYFMKFTKMQGCGNDYVYVNCFTEQIEDPEKTAVRVSDRHFGIGADGLILLAPSDVADCRMIMYNADGSQGAMCGNGIRCVAKLAYDSGTVRKERMTIETKSGIKTIDLTVENGRAVSARVDMGAPVLEAVKIPLNVKELAEEPGDARVESRADADVGDNSGAETPVADAAVIDRPILADGRIWRITGVSMGNPHAVIFLPEEFDLDGMEIEKIGPGIEKHPAFPDRVNTEFIKVLGPDILQMRVWERGSGETLACGTGACAAAVAAILNNKVSADGPVTVRLLGGELKIEWDREKNTVFMTGPAVTVFTGEI